jgi:cobalt-zinc-cadmium efflux system protein
MSRSSRLLVALAINAVLVAGQVVGGVVAHSSGLLADAGHNLTDVCAIAISLAAVRWAMRPRSDARSFGNHRGTILAALVNSAALAVVTVAIVVHSISELVHPGQVDGSLVAAVAGVAMVANAGCAWILHDGSSDLNMRASFVHMGADVLSSFVVLVAGVVIALTGSWERLDPIAALVVAALIMVEAFSLLRSSVEVLLESTPADVDLDDVRRMITAVDGVGEVHDLHVWSLSSEVRALSAHVVMTGHPTLEEAQGVGDIVRGQLSRGFHIAHSTLELECERCDDDHARDPCEMEPSMPRGVGGIARTKEDRRSATNR